MDKLSIIFRKDKILLSEGGIICSFSGFSFSEDQIVRKINLNTIELIELDCHEESRDYLISGAQWIPPKEALRFIDIRFANEF